jgi:hypothetical protein
MDDWLLLKPNQVRGLNLVREFRTATDVGAWFSYASSTATGGVPARWSASSSNTQNSRPMT